MTMKKIEVGDSVRILNKHGMTCGEGKVVSRTAKDRTHVSRRVPGRPLFGVEVTDSSGHTEKYLFPEGRLRKIPPESHETPSYP